MTRTAPNYKKTLNLPSTPFPMRANLAQNEPASLKRWQKGGLYEAIQEARTGAEPFIFHDGPPYANGPIHVGHLLNKVLKDLVVRSRAMNGQRCAFVPGWDCHGLPIEHKVMGDLHEKGKMEAINALGDDQRRMAIRRACRASAEKFVTLQSKQFQRLFTLADYDHPYITMDGAYEAAVLSIFAEMVEQELVYRRLKPVHWSIANETALAEAELDYEDREDPSIWVHFDAADPAAVYAAFETSGDQAPSFVIWTTTPWTLVANLAIAVAPAATYALVTIGDRVAVVAESLVESVAAAAGVDATVLATTSGQRLVGLAYVHPYMEGQRPVIAADHVTMEDGTGLVHTAPGHGTEDYVVGLEAGLEIYCPVQADGTYDASVPKWLAGVSVWDANDLVIAHLRDSGHLLHAETVTHSYPHDDRSHTPVIFRSTEQWFVAVDGDPSLRDQALAAAKSQIAFVPAWGANRMRGMLESRPDWCLSRQRAWGLPIPAFATADGQTLLTAQTVRAVAEVFAEHGSDAWFIMEPAQLLASWENPDSMDLSTLTQMGDIFDVWFESGTSWHAVMRQRDLGYPCDLYLEGSDQHRGWFQLSLLPALAATGTSPYRTVVTHGFMVDRDGRKMSKSGGNALQVEELLGQFGADVLRWWTASLPYEGDLKVDVSFIEAAADMYRKVRNTLRFLLGTLGGETARASCPQVDGMSLDGWVLAKCSAMSASVRESYLAFDFRSAQQELYDFCNDTLSATWCAASKDRLYCDPTDAARRQQSVATARYVAEHLCTLLAPILPHTADEAWAVLRGEDTESVHLQVWDDVTITMDERWASVMDVRATAMKALEEAKAGGLDNPIDAGLVLPDGDGVLAAMAIDDLADLCGVSRVELDASASAVAVSDLRDEPRCDRSWKRDASVAERSDGGMLSDRDAAAVGVS